MGQPAEQPVQARLHPLRQQQQQALHKQLRQQVETQHLQAVLPAMQGQRHPAPPGGQMLSDSDTVRLCTC
jgi:hypothetical protein